MAKKADAWKEYKEAALVDMMMKVLPKVIFAENNFFYQPRSGRVWNISELIFISQDLGELGIFLISGCCRGRSTIGPSREGEKIQQKMKILSWTYHTVLSIERQTSHFQKKSQPRMFHENFLLDILDSV